MRVCGDCESFKYCNCCDYGYCLLKESFFSDEAEACEDYDGPFDEPERKPHYQTDYERDNPRDTPEVRG